MDVVDICFCGLWVISGVRVLYVRKIVMKGSVIEVIVYCLIV